MYVIFDAGTDMWAYGLMKSWVNNDRVDFNFYDGHDLLRPLMQRVTDETTKARLRERLSTAKQVIVLVGKATKALRTWVPWEIEIALSLDLPVVVVNLNDKRALDLDLRPAGLRTTYSIHVAFEMKIVKHALDVFPAEHAKRTIDDLLARAVPGRRVCVARVIAARQVNRSRPAGDRPGSDIPARAR